MESPGIPGRFSRESSLWESVQQERRLFEHYQWQMQHQLIVSRADIADVFIFDGRKGMVFPVAPDEGSWPRIHEAWDAFARYLSEA
jgi:hypothetical protein